MTTPIGTQNAIDLFEIMEAREGRRSTLIASQLETNEWYLRIEGELMADSILNRIATAARYVDLGARTCASTSRSTRTHDRTRTLASVPADLIGGTTYA